MLRLRTPGYVLHRGKLIRRPPAGKGAYHGRRAEKQRRRDPADRPSANCEHQGDDPDRKAWRGDGRQDRGAGELSTAKRIAAGELEGGPAITTWHFGAHDKLGDAYARVEDALDEHGREPSGPPREVYHWIDLSKGDEGSGMSDPSTWRTELILPVK